MAENKSLAAVVIPVYQANLTEAEQMSLRQCMHVLGNYPVIIVKPAALDLSAHYQADGESGNGLPLPAYGC